MNSQIIANYRLEKQVGIVITALVIGLILPGSVFCQILNYTKVTAINISETGSFWEVADFDADSDDDVIFFQNAFHGKWIVYTNDSRGGFEFSNSGEIDHIRHNPDNPQPVIADVNNDGFSDFAVVEYFNRCDQIVIRLNDHEGSFVPIDPLSNSSLRSYIISEVTGDSLPDVITGSNYCRLFTNTGDGTFSEDDSIAPIGKPLAIFDVDGDGDNDLLGDIFIYLNDGEGNFEQTQELQNTQFYDIVVLDWDEDGDLDMFTLGSAGVPNKLRLWKNIDGWFEFEYEIEAFDEGRNDPTLGGHIDSTDIDGDGLTDIFYYYNEVGYIYNETGFIVPVLNRDGDQFEVGDRIELAGQTKPKAMDVTGDGLSEILTYGGSLFIQERTEEGLVYPCTDFNPLGFDVIYSPLDFDFDGLLDLPLLIRNGEEGTYDPYIAWAWNIGGGEMMAVDSLQMNGWTRLPAVDDFDGNGTNDYVLAVYSVDPERDTIWFIPGSEFGGFAEPRLLWALDPAWQTMVWELVSADFDLDDDPDLIVKTSRCTEYLRNDGSANFESVDTIPTFDASSFTPADVNNDGWIDLAYASGISVVVNYNNREGMLNHENRTLDIGFEAKDIQVEDLDNDDQPELILTTNDRIAVVHTIIGGAFEVAASYDVPIRNYSGVILSDFDNDGDKDILFASNDPMILFRNIGGLEFEIEGYYMFGSTGPGYDYQRCYLTDMNGDENPDLIRCSDKGFFYDYDFNVGVVEHPGHSIAVPQLLSLSAFPNPFNSSTSLSYFLPTPGRYAIDVMDIQGRLVTRLSDGWKETGSYREVFEGNRLGSGLYFIRLSGNGGHLINHLTLIK